MFNKLKAKLNNIKFYEEKKRFLLFSVMLLLALFLAYYLFKGAYASYKSSAKLVTNIDKALYLIDTDKMSFNIDPEQIVPSLEPYTYKFSVSNFNSSTQGEVSLLYTVKVITTTNLPISIQLYRNENYDDSQATPLLTGARTVQDEDGSWYNIYDTNNSYTMDYKDKITDIYTLVVNFPKNYSSSTTYADCIESIEVRIESSQKVDQRCFDGVYQKT